jgi:hypothetical protein
MEMLVDSLNDIKSDELIICRFACCYGDGTGNEIIVLCDPSDKTNHKITCSECGKIHEIDMKPVFSFGAIKRPDIPNDSDISKELNKVTSKISVV